MSTKYIIMDWAGNDLSYYHGEFDSFDQAECALGEFIEERFGEDAYEQHRDEYVITEKGE